MKPIGVGRRGMQLHDLSLCKLGVDVEGAFDVSAMVALSVRQLAASHFLAGIGLEEDIVDFHIHESSFAKVRRNVYSCSADNQEQRKEYVHQLDHGDKFTHIFSLSEEMRSLFMVF